MIKTDEKGNIVACITTKEDLDYTNFDLETIDYYDNFLIPSYEEEIERLNKRIKELEERFKATTEDLCEESTKIEKAIEYIEKHTENIDRGQYYEDYVETYSVLQILKESDKE